jgi:hypothetical protein
MLRGPFARFFCVIALMAVPASAEITYDSSAAWYALPFSNLHIITFDGLGDQNALGTPNAGYTLSGVTFFGFINAPYNVNNYLQLAREDNSAAPWYNYGRTGPDGNPATNPVVLRGTSATNTSSLVGFEIVLPTPVTAFGVEIMSSTGGFHVAVNLGGNAISNPGGAYPTGTLTTAASHGRTFFGVTSATAFNTIDIIGGPSIPSGEYLVIDNLVYGQAPADTVEPQSAIFLLTGLGTMLLARRMKRLRVTAAAIS